jgi:hypothetical protein
LYDLKLPRRLELIKYFRIINNVRWLKIADVSETISVPIIRASGIRSPIDGER